MNGPSQSVVIRLLINDEPPFRRVTANDDSTDEPAPLSSAACGGLDSMATPADNNFRSSDPRPCFSPGQSFRNG
ncbi:hypothetical protein BZM26_36465 [Paraburkholderia strydomiana]|nr:hypothetical protein BZM26_36465 [Paraburkholderia strydomiana]